MTSKILGLDRIKKLGLSQFEYACLLSVRYLEKKFRGKFAYTKSFTIVAIPNVFVFSVADAKTFLILVTIMIPLQNHCCCYRQYEDSKKLKNI